MSQDESLEGSQGSVNSEWDSLSIENGSSKGNGEKGNHASWPLQRPALRKQRSQSAQQDRSAILLDLESLDVGKDWNIRKLSKINAVSKRVSFLHPITRESRAHSAPRQVGELVPPIVFTSSSRTVTPGNSPRRGTSKKMNGGRASEPRELKERRKE
ncbi:unnamed protein product, partial [Mesorhabditis belari]|uniref:Uncharacterized protein n=1 Tax=Mesorhabditis belari TaxID=2138241 RepID=A0AAF3F8K5_9BILA